jgi:hypothetical protein
VTTKIVILIVVPSSPFLGRIRLTHATHFRINLLDLERCGDDGIVVTCYYYHYHYHYYCCCCCCCCLVFGDGDRVMWTSKELVGLSLLLFRQQQIRRVRTNVYSYVVATTEFQPRTCASPCSRNSAGSCVRLQALFQLQLLLQDLCQFPSLLQAQFQLQPLLQARLSSSSSSSSSPRTCASLCSRVSSSFQLPAPNEDSDE